MKKIIVIIFISLISCLYFSCEKDLSSTNTNTERQVIYKESSKEKSFHIFSKALSKIVHEEQSVRKFIKDEALKKFDTEYDVLYFMIKDEIIVNNKTFKDFLLDYLSQDELMEIEKNIPLLNISIPNINALNLNPEELNIDDDEIPVAYSGYNGKEDVVEIFFNGENEGTLDGNIMPAFSLFVVNENSKIILNEGFSTLTKINNANVDYKTIFSFRDVSFNGLDKDIKYAYRQLNTVDKSSELQKAFSYFYKGDNSINQVGFQRDYLYYGLTPSIDKGSLNYATTEYLRSITLNPRMLGHLEKGGKLLINPDIRQDRRTLSSQEIINRMWSGGSYRLSFEVISNSSSKEKFYISARPDELFDLTNAYTHTRRNGSFWRRSRNWYKFDLNKVKVKEFFPQYNSVNLSLGKWHAKDALTKDLIIELDVVYDEVMTKEYTYTTQRSASFKFTGDVKLGLGSDKIGVGIAVDNSNSTTQTIKISRTVSIKNIHLATFNIGYYQAIVKPNGQFYEYEKGDVKITLNTL